MRGTRGFPCFTQMSALSCANGTQAHTCAQALAHTHTYTHAHTHIHTQTCMHACTCSGPNTKRACTCPLMYTCTLTHAHTTMCEVVKHGGECIGQELLYLPVHVCVCLGYACVPQMPGQLLLVVLELFLSLDAQSAAAAVRSLEAPQDSSGSACIFEATLSSCAGSSGRSGTPPGSSCHSPVASDSTAHWQQAHALHTGANGLRLIHGHAAGHTPALVPSLPATTPVLRTLRAPGRAGQLAAAFKAQAAAGPFSASSSSSSPPASLAAGSSAEALGCSGGGSGRGAGSAPGLFEQQSLGNQQHNIEIRARFTQASGWGWVPACAAARPVAPSRLPGLGPCTPRNVCVRALAAAAGAHPTDAERSRCTAARAGRSGGLPLGRWRRSCRAQPPPPQEHAPPVAHQRQPRGPRGRKWDPHAPRLPHAGGHQLESWLVSRLVGESVGRRGLLAAMLAARLSIDHWCSAWRGE